jgi:hypothetical protein
LERQESKIHCSSSFQSSFEVFVSPSKQGYKKLKRRVTTASAPKVQLNPFPPTRATTVLAPLAFELAARFGPVVVGALVVGAVVAEVLFALVVRFWLVVVAFPVVLVVVLVGVLGETKALFWAFHDKQTVGNDSGKLTGTCV